MIALTRCSNGWAFPLPFGMRLYLDIGLIFSAAEM